MRSIFLTLVVCIAVLLTGCQATQSNATASFIDASARLGQSDQPPFLIADEPNPVATHRINRSVHEKLNKKISVVFKETPLFEVIHDLRQKTGVIYFADWITLDDVGIKQKDAITFSLDHVSAHQVNQKLILVLNSLESLEPLDAVVRDGMVLITSKRQLNKKKQVRIYDIRDFIAPPIGLSRDNGIPVADFSVKFYFYNELETSLFGDEDPLLDHREDSLNALTEAIWMNVGEMEDWNVYGGVVSHLQEYHGDLIVKTTPEGHDQLARLLAGLRASRARAAAQSKARVLKQPRMTEAQFMALLQRIEKKLDAFKAAEEQARKEAVREAKQQPN